MPSIIDRLNKAIMEQVVRERNGEAVNLIDLKAVISTYIPLGYIEADIKLDGGIYQWVGVGNMDMYDRFFEQPLLLMVRQSCLFINCYLQIKQEYAQKSMNMITTLSCPEYLLEVQKFLKTEEGRAISFYHEKTKVPLIKMIEQELITNHAQSIVEREGSGCASMFKHAKLQELELMYRLFLRVPETLSFMTQKLHKYTKEKGDSVTSDEGLKKEPMKFIQKLIDLYVEIDKMVEECFHSDERFKKTRDMVF